MVGMADAVVAVSVVNLVLLSALAYVWVSNYRKFSSPHILGLIIFAVALSAENVAAIYFHFRAMEMLYAASPEAQAAAVVLRGLQLVALLALTWTTMK
jgi:uncharacterized protein YqgC (DUF456 family)